MWERCLNSSFAKKNFKKSQQVPRKLVLGGLILATSSSPSCNKGQQTDTIFYVTTGNVTHYLSEMSKYGKTKGQ